MNFYLIIGPQAVGKMTVGQELAHYTGARLFYNHMTIDLVDYFFDYSTPQGKWLVKEYRDLLFNAVLSCDDYPGFIFTFVCDFETPDGLAYVYDTCKAFEAAGHTAYIIELNSDYETRKQRNVTENRMIHKRLKQNIPKSTRLFERFEQGGRTKSLDGEIDWPRYVRIDNTELSPEQVVKVIVSSFSLNDGVTEHDASEPSG